MNPTAIPPAQQDPDSARASAHRRRAIWVDACLILWSLAILAVCGHKAATASITHDEAFTFLHYPWLSYSDLLAMAVKSTNDQLVDPAYYCSLEGAHIHHAAYTNNHLLNSVAMKGSIMLFGTSELACRLPNLLALAMYLAYAILFLRRAHPLIALLGLPLLTTNPFFMEMFTLARGYGLSYGFLIMALYHGWRAAATGRWSHIVLLHAGGALAAWSNFALLTGYLAALLAYAVMAWAAWRTDPIGARARNRILLMHGLLLAAAILSFKDPLGHVLEVNRLDFGGKATFYWDTVCTLIDGMVPGVSLRGGVMQTAWVLLTLPVAIALAIVLIGLRKRGLSFVKDHGGLAMAVLTLVLIGLGAYAQHLLFGVDHLKGRFALFLLPPLMLSLIGLLSLWASRQVLLPSLLMLGACTWVVPRFAADFNRYFSWEWRYDVRTKEAMQALVADHATVWKADGFVQVGNNWLFEPAMNYYRHTMGLGWMCELNRDGIRADDDYRYVLIDDSAARIGFTPVVQFDHSNAILLRSDAQLRALRGTMSDTLNDTLKIHEPAPQAVSR